MSNVKKNSKDLIKNSLIILLGKGSTQFIVFLLLPLYTSVLSTAEYGTMDLITTYVTLLAPLISLQLENAVFRFLIDSRKNNKNKKSFISSGFICMLILLIIGFILISIATLAFKIKFGTYLALLVSITMISNYFLSVARGLGNNLEYAKSSIVAGFSSVVLNIIFLLIFKIGIIGAFISQIMSNVLCSIYCFLKLRLYNYISFGDCNKENIISQLKYSLPLVPNSVNWWIINASDKTLVSIFCGTAFNGIYSVSNKFSAAYIAVYNIFNLSWSESASLHINDKDRDEFFSSTFNNMYKMFYSLSLLLIAFLPIMFCILVDSKYLESYQYIPFLLFGSVLNVIVGLLSGIYIAKKLTKEVAITSLIAAIINVITNFLFIKKIQIWAAVISTIIAFGVMSVYRFIDVKKYVELRVDYKFLLLSIVIYVFVTYLYLINCIITNIANVIICLALFFILNKKTIAFLGESVKNKLLKK